MRSVHVLRKPCSESTVAANVLRHGTGVLNIDATRIRLTEGEIVHTPQSDPSRRSGEVGTNLGFSGNSTDAFRRAQVESIERTNTLGRWPANLVLQHLPTCEQTGTREEPGYTVNRFTDGAKPFGGGAGHPYESEQVLPSTVPVWACGAGCPVAGLDKQSGIRQDSVAVNRNRTDDENQSWFGKRKSQTGADVGYGGGGGASRFFKQVGGRVTPSGGGRGGKG